MTNKEQEYHYRAIAETANTYSGFVNLFRPEVRHPMWLEMAGLIESADIVKHNNDK